MISRKASSRQLLSVAFKNDKEVDADMESCLLTMFLEEGKQLPSQVLLKLRLQPSQMEHLESEQLVSLSEQLETAGCSDECEEVPCI